MSQRADDNDNAACSGAGASGKEAAAAEDEARKSKSRHGANLSNFTLYEGEFLRCQLLIEISPPTP